MVLVLFEFKNFSSLFSPLPLPRGSRFRSRLSSVFGVGEKKRLVMYSGRGRPPKRVFVAGEGNQVGGAPVAGWVEPQWLGGWSSSGWVGVVLYLVLMVAGRRE